MTLKETEINKVSIFRPKGSCQRQAQPDIPHIWERALSRGPVVQVGWGQGPVQASLACGAKHFDRNGLFLDIESVKI